MKKKLCLLGGVLICFLSSHAQEDTLEVGTVEDAAGAAPAQNVLPNKGERHHEFGVNLAPVLVELAGGMNNAPLYQFYYKVADDREGFRFAAGWTNIDPVRTTEKVRLNDSTLATANNTIAVDLFQVRLGYERYFPLGDKGLEWVAGGDVLAGRRIERRTLDVEDQTPVPVSELLDIPEVTYPNQQYTYATWGASLFGGLRYEFADHWALQAQTGPDFSWNKQISPAVSKDQNFTEVRYNFFNDIALFYRF